MTTPLDIPRLSEQIGERFPGSAQEAGGEWLLLNSDSLVEVARYCHDDPALALDMLVSITGVDYIDYFELVYHLVSIKHNHSLCLKTRAFSRDNPQVPSVTGIWQGATLQEREIYDLMGVSFVGHPSMKRIFLWEGFEGHPQRKDYTMA